MPKFRKKSSPILNSQVADRVMQKMASKLGDQHTDTSQKPETFFALAVVAFIQAQEVMNTERTPKNISLDKHIDFDKLKIGSKAVNLDQKEVDRQANLIIKLSEGLYGSIARSEKGGLDTNSSVKADVSGLLNIGKAGRRADPIDEGWIQQMTKVYQKFEDLKGSGDLQTVINNWNKITGAKISLTRPATPVRSRSNSVSESEPEIQDMFTQTMRDRNNTKPAPARQEPPKVETTPLAKGARSDDLQAKGRAAISGVSQADTAAQQAAAQQAAAAAQAQKAAEQAQKRAELLKANLRLKTVHASSQAQVEAKQTQLAEEKKERIDNIAEEIKNGRAYTELGAGRPLQNFSNSGMTHDPVTTIRVSERIKNFEALNERGQVQVNYLNNNALKNNFLKLTADDVKTPDPVITPPPVAIAPAAAERLFEQSTKPQEPAPVIEQEVKYGGVANMFSEDQENSESIHVAPEEIAPAVNEPENITESNDNLANDEIEEEPVIEVENEIDNGVAPVSEEEEQKAQAEAAKTAAAEAEAAQAAAIETGMKQTRTLGSQVFAEAAAKAATRNENAKIAEVRNLGSSVFAEAAAQAARRNEAAEAKKAELTEEKPNQNIDSNLESGVDNTAPEQKPDNSQAEAAAAAEPAKNEAEQVENNLEEKPDQAENLENITEENDLGLNELYPESMENADSIAAANAASMAAAALAEEEKYIGIDDLFVEESKNPELEEPANSAAATENKPENINAEENKTNVIDLDNINLDLNKDAATNTEEKDATATAEGPSATIVMPKPKLEIDKDFAIALVKTTEAATDKKSLGRIQTLMESMRLKQIEFATDNFQNLANRESLQQQWQNDLKMLHSKVVDNSSRLMVAQEHLLECQQVLMNDKTTQGMAKNAGTLFVKANEAVVAYEKMWNALESMTQNMALAQKNDYSDRIKLTASEVTVIQTGNKDEAAIQTEIQAKVRELSNSAGSNGFSITTGNAQPSAKVDIQKEIAIMALHGNDTHQLNKPDSPIQLNMNTIYSVGNNARGNVTLQVQSIRQDFDPAALMTKYIMDRPALLSNFPSVANENNQNKISSALMQMCSTVSGAPPTVDAIKQFLTGSQDNRQRLETTKGFVDLVSKQMAADLRKTLCDPKNPSLPSADLLEQARKFVEDFRNAEAKAWKADNGDKPMPVKPMIFRGGPETIRMAAKIYCEAMKQQVNTPEGKQLYGYEDKVDPTPVKKATIQSALGYLNPVAVVKQHIEHKNLDKVGAILKNADQVAILNSKSETNHQKTIAGIEKAVTGLQKIENKLQDVKNVALEHAIDQTRTSGGPRRGSSTS